MVYIIISLSNIMSIVNLCFKLNKETCPFTQFNRGLLMDCTLSLYCFPVLDSRNLNLGGPGVFSGGPFGSKTISPLGSMGPAHDFKPVGPSVLKEVLRTWSAVLICQTLMFPFSYSLYSCTQHKGINARDRM